MNGAPGGRRDTRTGAAAESLMYDRGTMKIVVLACAIIVLTIIFSSVLDYFSTRAALVDKLKSHDIVYIADMIAAKVDGRLARAQETAAVLGRDPMVEEWLRGGEKDDRLGMYVKEKMVGLAESRDYENVFVIGDATRRYRSEGSKAMAELIRDMPDAAAFYRDLRYRPLVNLRLYDAGRLKSYIFIDALVGGVARSAGVAGVGFNTDSLMRELQRYHFSPHSRLWIVDNRGTVVLSDRRDDDGKPLRQYIPAAVVSQIVADQEVTTSTPKVLEYRDVSGETMDLAYKMAKASEWKLVYASPRRDGVAILTTIRRSALVTGGVTLVFMILIFYMISRRMADPLQRAVLLQRELEGRVARRTRELAAKNQEMMDSIDYAKKLQEAVLPTPDELREIFRGHFVLWRPRDVVGGDFYWARRRGDVCFVALADCTGHGVPGAFMTMLVSATLTQIVDGGCLEPAWILAGLNRRVKRQLHRGASAQVSDDGLDIAVCRIEAGRKLTFAGARLPLYICRDGRAKMLKGDRSSVGYRSTAADAVFAQHEIDARPGDRFYLATDGFIDQNGGAKDFSFGRTKFLRFIEAQRETELAAQEETFAAALAKYQGGAAQRDDITVVGFSVR